MRAVAIAVAVFALAGFCVFLVVSNQNSRSGQANSEKESYEFFFDLAARDRTLVKNALQEIEQDWHPGSPVMLLEVARFAKRRDAREGAIALLKSKTKKNFGDDFNRWYEWLWKLEYDPHPQYAEFKRNLYRRVDPRFQEYFEATDSATIRLDEIRWGGVIRDGIPPLESPAMISAEKATYLADTDVVFGIDLNNDSRCYPKRILAWHEMFKDTIGGESVCGVY